jgi:hypothetical protein
MNTLEFYKTTLDFVDKTTQILKIASELAAEKEASDKAVNAKIAGTVQTLKSAQLIDAHETKLAEAQLRNPAEALAVLSNVVSHYREQIKSAEAKLASGSIGTADVGSKTASAGMKKNANYVGKRRGSADGLSESDAALARLLPGRSN